METIRRYVYRDKRHVDISFPAENREQLTRFVESRGFSFICENPKERLTEAETIPEDELMRLLGAERIAEVPASGPLAGVVRQKAAAEASPRPPEPLPSSGPPAPRPKAESLLGPLPGGRVGPVGFAVSLGGV
jgi:hypothetical protein